MTLSVYNRTALAQRLSLLVNDEHWITSRTPLYHLDLAVANEVLFKHHFKEAFPDHLPEIGVLKQFDADEPRFHPDDIGVGFRGGGSSNFFHAYVAITESPIDKIGMTRFFDFLKYLNADAPSLSSAEDAARFLTLAGLCGYQRWKKRVLRPCSHKHHSHLLVDRVFSYVYPSLLKGLRKTRSPLLLRKFWELFCVTDKTRFLMFQDVPDAEHLEFILEVANRTRFDFWGLRYGAKRFTERVIVDYVKRGHCDLAMMMLDYGFHLGKADIVRMFEENILSLGKNHLRISPLSFFCIKEFLHNGFMVWFLVRCCATYSYRTVRVGSLARFLELYRRLYRSLPLPSLPRRIVRKYLLSNLDKVRYSSKVVEELTTLYEKSAIHPPDGNVVAPQRLDHLCRCVIRERLGKNFQLPTGIDQLNLPGLFKRFLNLEF